MGRKFYVIPMVLISLSAFVSCKKDVAEDRAAITTAPGIEAAPAVPAAPQGKRTVVTIIADSPGSTELALPVHSNNQRVKFEDLKDVKGTWEQTFGGERIRSLEQGAGFTVEIINDKPEIPFLQTLDGAQVTITYDGKSRVVSLKGDSYGWRPEKLD